MEVFNYIKKIYSEKGAFSNHITIFSILGIMAISFNSYLSSVFGNIYGSFFDFISLNPIQNYLLLVVATMAFIFSLGFMYGFVHNVFKGEFNLPESSLSAYTIFIRMLPLFLCWSVYLVIFSLLGFSLISITTFWFYLYFSILICMLPFVNLIYVWFAKDFQYRKLYFSLSTIWKVFYKTLGDVIFLSAKILLLSIIPFVLVYLMFKYSDAVNHQTVKLILKLGALSIGIYFSNIMNYLYNMGLVKIVKEKLN
ncbi:hypothetical protein HDR58_02155 [bacterium]|nr:hypothetical protein [bacterium]